MRTEFGRLKGREKVKGEESIARVLPPNRSREHRPRSKAQPQTPIVLVLLIVRAMKQIRQWLGNQISRAEMKGRNLLEIKSLAAGAAVC